MVIARHWHLMLFAASAQTFARPIKNQFVLRTARRPATLWLVLFCFRNRLCLDETLFISSFLNFAVYENFTFPCSLKRYILYG